MDQTASWTTTKSYRSTPTPFTKSSKNTQAPHLVSTTFLKQITEKNSSETNSRFRTTKLPDTTESTSKSLTVTPDSSQFDVSSREPQRRHNQTNAQRYTESSTREINSTLDSGLLVTISQNTTTTVSPTVGGSPTRRRMRANRRRGRARRRRLRNGREGLQRRRRRYQRTPQRRKKGRKRRPKNRGKGPHRISEKKKRKRKNRRRRRKNPNLPFRVPVDNSDQYRRNKTEADLTHSNVTTALSKSDHSTQEPTVLERATTHTLSTATHASNSASTTVSYSSTVDETSEISTNYSETSFDSSETSASGSKTSSSEITLPDYLRHRDRRQLVGGGGIIQAPLLSACKPGAKRDYNYKCRPKFIPQERKSSDSSEETIAPAPPRIKCPKVSVLMPWRYC